MTLDELKQNWNNIDLKLTEVEDTARSVERSVATNRTSAMRSRIRSGSIIMGIISLLVPFLFIPFYTMSPYLVVFAFLFFLFCSFTYFYFARSVGNCEYGSMPVTEALRRTIDLERLRERLRTIRMVIGIPLICFFIGMLYSDDEPLVFVGAAIGAVIGTLIGCLINYRFASTLRSMKRDLEEIENS